ncbi:MAG: hypothetical protein ACJA00_003356 [Myxococcota bacterium]|jgi:hypothetical protein
MGVNKETRTSVMDIDPSELDITSLTTGISRFSDIIGTSLRFGQVATDSECSLAQCGDRRIKVEDVPPAAIGVEVKDRGVLQDSVDLWCLGEQPRNVGTDEVGLSPSEGPRCGTGRRECRALRKCGDTFHHRPEKLPEWADTAVGTGAEKYEKQ